MRVTTNSKFIPYQRNIQELQSDKFRNELKISTGKDILSTSDAPGKLVDVKKLTSMIESNGQYLSVISESLGEMYATDEYMRTIGDKIQIIRETTIEATTVSNTASISNLGAYVKGLLTDLINIANQEYNDHYLFSGTMTTPESIKNTNLGTDDLPFEIVEGTPDANNPSGLSVIFKGNNEERIVNKGPRSAETVNITADQIFGAGSTDVFNKVIELYNTLAYDENGVKREEHDELSTDDFIKLDGLQKELGYMYDEVNRIGGLNGVKINRLEAIEAQMKEENIRLKDMRSLKDDANVAEASMDLMKSENALQYTLQTAGRLIRYSLFDFLS